MLFLFTRYPVIIRNRVSSDPPLEAGRPSGFQSLEDVTDDEDEPEAGPPPKRQCNLPPPGM